jgi:putative ABC transport system permease protein
MIKFILKGIIRDRSRSLFPILTVFIGVALTVFLYGWIKGAETNFIESSAKFSSGHVKIMSRAYAEEEDQIPNDLAYIGVEALIKDLEQDYPEIIWTSRIRFGGLLDVPDEQGETRSQGPMGGLAVDLFSENSPEWGILNLEKAIVRGRLPEKSGEILLSDDFALKLDVKPGETATLISSTMYGSMAAANFTVAGTIRFGVTAMDRGAMLADLKDIQQALDMEDAAGEILGFYNDFVYRYLRSDDIVESFKAKYPEEQENEFLPVMENLHQSEMGSYLGMVGIFAAVIILIFITAMSIVLWNAGLMGSLRRYGEIGVRLAMGESKGHLYRSLISESLIIGCIGSVFGTILGLAITYYLQAHGIDISSMMKNSSIFFSNVMKARVTSVSYFIGFIPGLLATLLGTSISGIGVYKRQTSQLIKELEV